MNATPNPEVNRRLTRQLLLDRIRSEALWIVLTILLVTLVALSHPDVRALLRDDRLGKPIEMRGIVVAMYVPDSDKGYKPPIPVVELNDGHRQLVSNPHGLSLRKGDHVIVEERSYEKSGEKRYRIKRHASDDE